MSPNREATHPAEVMARHHPIGDLENPSDLLFQRVTWRYQRVAWCIMAVILGIALLGGFGGGLLSSATVGPTQGPHITYPWICRVESTTALDVYATTSPDGEARVWVAWDYVDRADITRVDPEPVRVENGPDGLTYVVRVARPTETITGDPLARVRFTINPDRPGRMPCQIRPGSGPVLRFNQFVHP